MSLPPARPHKVCGTGKIWFSQTGSRHCLKCSPYPVSGLWPKKVYTLIQDEWVEDEELDEGWEYHRSMMLSMSPADKKYMESPSLRSACWLCKSVICTELCLAANFDTWNIFKFGKYKGKTLRDPEVPDSYLRWYAKSNHESRSSIKKILRGEIPKAKTR